MKSRPLPDRESTAPHWSGSATAQLQAKDAEIARLKLVIAQLIGDMNAAIDRASREVKP